MYIRTQRVLVVGVSDNGYSLIIDNIQYDKIPMDINIDDYILTTDETNKEIILIKDKE